MKNKDIWIISETENQFQDNGFTFFKYMRRNYPQKNVYYVIDKKVQDLKKLEIYGNILYFNSFKSIYYLFGATKIISTHGIWMLPQELGIFRKQSKKMLKAEKIMLQHGITALKNVGNAYNKNKFFLNNKFIVSSKLEKEIIKKYLDYEEENIVLSGMPRLDELKDESNKEEFKILYMPTYRKNIKTEKEFLISDFYIKSKSFLENIIKLDSKIKIDFYLHKEFQKYIKYYQIDNKNIEIKKNYLTLKGSLKKCNLLITDFSSVCFDFLFMGKPILFYLMDEEAYKVKKNSYMDYDKYFKSIAFSKEEELIKEIKKIINNEINKYKFLKLKKVFFEYDDNKNCERLYKEIKSNKKFK